MLFIVVVGVVVVELGDNDNDYGNELERRRKKK